MNQCLGDSETLPISQEELAQLMAQSLASSPSNYGRSEFGHQQQTEKQPNDEFEANYEAGEEQAGEAPHQPEEDGQQEAKQEAQEGQDEEQDSDEGSPYQDEGHSEGAQDESRYQQSREPQQTYRENSGYQKSAPSYQSEREQYQSGQYPNPHSNSYGTSRGESRYREEAQPVSYDERRHSQYDSSSRTHPYGSQSRSNQYRSESPNTLYENSGVQEPRYSHESSYTAPGSGYSGPGSESFMSYDVRSSPKSKRYRN